LYAGDFGREGGKRGTEFVGRCGCSLSRRVELASPDVEPFEWF
jgi:hypothetical protein